MVSANVDAQQLQIHDGAVTVGRFTVTPTGLRSQGDPTYAQWLEVGEMLRVMVHAVQFAVGDWMNMGEAIFPKDAQQVIDSEHWSEETVRVYKWVAEKVPPENRRTDVLSFTHHQIVAALPVAEQRRWIEEAAGLGETAHTPWSSNELKRQLRTRQELTAGTDPVRWLLMVECQDEAAVEALEAVAVERRHLYRRVPVTTPAWQWWKAEERS